MFSITDLALFGTTAVIAVGSALGSLIIAYPFSIWLSSLSQTVSRVVSTLVVVPFLLPPLLVALVLMPAVEEVKIDSSIGIYLILFSHVLMNFGFLARVLVGGMITTDQVENAKLDGASTWQIRILLALPQQLPAATAASLLVALYSATSYGLVVTLSGGFVKTLETEIAKTALQNLDLERAATLATMQTLLTLLLFFTAQKFQAGPAALDELHVQPSRVEGWIKVFAISLVFMVIGFLMSALAGALSGPGLIDNIENLFGKGARNLLNISVVEASFNSLRNAAITTVATLPLAYLLAARKRSASWVLIPLGISPVVIGLGFLFLSGYLPRELTSSWVFLPMVQVIFALPIGYQILKPAMNRLDSDVLAAAKLDGAGAVRRSLLIEFPLLSRSIGLAVAFTAMVSLGEFGAASFLAFGANETLPIVMFKLMARPGAENLGMALTAASIHILLVAFIVWFSLKPTHNRQLADPTLR